MQALGGQNPQRMEAMLHAPGWAPHSSRGWVRGCPLRATLLQGFHHVAVEGWQSWLSWSDS